MQLPLEDDQRLRRNRIIEKRRQVVEPAERRHDAPLAIAEGARGLGLAHQRHRAAEMSFEGERIDVVGGRQHADEEAGGAAEEDGLFKS